MLVRIAFVLCAGLLAACGPIYETVYDYASPPTAQGQLCASQCSQIASLCRQNCDLREERCFAEARERGALEYERYVRERQANGEQIEKSVSDFTYDYSCYSSSSCKAECTTPYNQCFTTCGGSVTSRTVCTAFCN